MNRNYLYKFYCVCCFIFYNTYTHAQSSALQGSIKDSSTTLPLEDASIVLYNSTDSLMLAGTVSKKKGMFVLNKLKPGKYYLVVTFTGYENKTVSNVDMQNGQLVDLGIIAIKPSRADLKNIVVRTQRNDIYNKLGMQVYKASQFENAKGGTAIDVLKNMPSVAVNVEGVITYRGSQGFLILLNGKPVQVDAVTILNQIPANAIETIELITSPSAKYDPDGKGIINIVTKRGYGDGFTLTANVQGGLPAIHTYDNSNKPVRFGADATITYKKKKWETAAGISYLRNDVSGYREGNVNTSVNSVFTSFPSSGERSFKRYNSAARASVNFTADKQNVFSAGIYYGKRFQARTADLLYNNSKKNIISGEMFYDFTYYNTNLQTKQGDFTLGNFDYTHTFKNKSALTFTVLYEYADLYGNVKNANLNYPKITDTIQYTYNTNTNPLQGYRAGINYLIKQKQAS